MICTLMPSIELVKGAAERFPGKAWRDIMDFVAYHTSSEWWYTRRCSHCQRLKCGTTQALYMLGNAPRGDARNPLRMRAARPTIAAFGPSRPPWPREYTYWRNGRRIERLVTAGRDLRSDRRNNRALERRP